MGGERHSPAALPLGKRPGIHCTIHEVVCASRPVWAGTQNLASTGVRIRTVQPLDSDKCTTVIRTSYFTLCLWRT